MGCVQPPSMAPKTLMKVAQLSGIIDVLSTRIEEPVGACGFAEVSHLCCNSLMVLTTQLLSVRRISRTLHSVHCASRLRWLHAV